MILKRKWLIAWALLLFVVDGSQVGASLPYYWELTHTHSLQVQVACWALMIALFLCTIGTVTLSWLLPRSIGWLCLLPAAVAMLHEFGYFRALARVSNDADFELALVATNFQHWRDAIVQYFAPSTLIALVMLFAPLLAPIRRSRRWLWPLVFVTLANGAVVCLHWHQRDSLWGLREVPATSLGAFERTVGSTLLSRAFNDIGTRTVIPPISSVPPQANVVLIMDESIRGDHLSLNGYERPTTPFLDGLAHDGRLNNWGVAVSGTTCSVASAWVALTGLRTADLPDTTGRRFRRPTLWQYAKAMGFRTVFLDGSVTSRWNGRPDDYAKIDDWRTMLIDPNGVGRDPITIDQVIAEQLAQILSTGGGHFIWVWKQGAHTPYGSRFPPTATIFTPSLSSVRPTAEDRQALVNAYDNSIRWSVDEFFRTLLRDPAFLDRTSLVYTSDHGQTLEPTRASHCGTTEPESMVPLFAMGSGLANADVTFPAAHANIFATLLDLMGVPETARTEHYAPSLLGHPGRDAQPETQFWGSDLYRGEPLAVTRRQNGKKDPRLAK